MCNLIYTVCLVCLESMHVHSAGISSGVLESLAESEITIILQRLCISPTEAIHQEDRPYMQQIGSDIIRVLASGASKNMVRTTLGANYDI